MTSPWKPRTELPTEDKRVITLSPVYPKGHISRYRIMDAQFVRISIEVESWFYLDELDPEQFASNE